MCRLAAYLGPEIALEKIVVAPQHSLLEQSQSAAEAKLAVNGDGFGIAWYGEGPEPSLYRDVLPAWSDGNLPNLCRMIKSRLFLAHVRASTTGEISRVNCHPFTFENLAFMHNGQIAQFEDRRRALEARLPDALYKRRRGNTDSELLFLLLLTHGLSDEPKLACERVIALLESSPANRKRPNRLTCAFSDGENLFAFRHSCDMRSPSLYVSNPSLFNGLALASEPLDGISQNWRKIPDNHFVTISGKEVIIEPLDVEQVLSVAV